MSTVIVTVSVSQDFPAPNGLASIQFTDLPDSAYTVVLLDSAGTQIGTQQITTQTQSTAVPPAATP